MPDGGFPPSQMHRIRRICGRIVAGGVCCAVMATLPHAVAGVAVVANRTAVPITLTLTPPDQKPTSVVLEGGDARPIEVGNPLPFQVQHGANGPTGVLWPQQAYELVESGEAGLALRRLDFGARSESAYAPAEGERLALRKKAVVSVKIFVDEDELRRQEVWEPALRERIREGVSRARGACRRGLAGGGNRHVELG